MTDREAKATSRPWTEEEVAALRRGYRRWGAPALARRLRRTPRAVRLKARALGVTTPRPPRWTAEELDFLRRHVGSMPYREIARALGRGEAAVITRAMRLGLPGRRAAWTHREIATLRALYGTMPNAELSARHLPARDPEAIREKARRMGLARPHFRATPENLARLRALVIDGYSDEDVARLLGTNDVTARKYRRQLGLPHNGYGERWREKIREATRTQLREAGCDSLSELRWLARRVEDAKSGKEIRP